MLRINGSFMFHRILLVLLIVFSFGARAADLDQARELAAGGDLPAALDAYMAILGEEPANIDALEAAAEVANQMQITEMASDFLIQAVAQAVAAGDRQLAERLNQAITALYDQTPSWVEEKRSNAAVFDDGQADALVAIDEMTAEAEALFNIGDY